MYKVLKCVTGFFGDQRGAVQVEWMVLTAAVVGLCLPATDAISTALGEQGTIIIQTMQARVDAGLAGYE